MVYIHRVIPVMTYGVGTVGMSTFIIGLIFEGYVIYCCEYYITLILATI